MGEVIGWVDPPLIPSSVMGRLENTIGSQIPHLRVSVLKVLLHTKLCLLGLILAISHAPEFRKRLLNGALAVRASITRTTIVSPSLVMDFFSSAVTYISKPTVNKVLRKII